MGYLCTCLLCIEVRYLSGWNVVGMDGGAWHVDCTSYLAFIELELDLAQLQERYLECESYE
jgi:hypothetical protein